MQQIASDHDQAMTQVALQVAILAELRTSVDEIECPSCKPDKTPGQYTTVLERGNIDKHIRSPERMQKCKSSSVYPLDKAGCHDAIKAWEVAEPNGGAHVVIGSTGHHIIPISVVKPSRSTKWLIKKKGKIEHDVGYTVNSAQNGITLPIKSSGDLALSELEIMQLTRRQIHRGGKHNYGLRRANGDIKTYTGAEVEQISARAAAGTGAGSVSASTPKSYKQEARNRCDMVGDLAGRALVICPECKDKQDNKKTIPPPYALISWLNAESSDMRMWISGPAKKWKCFVSSYAHKYHLQCRQYRRDMIGSRGLKVTRILI